MFVPAGELTMLAAPAVLEEGRQRAQRGDLIVDFSQVTAADSAALALLLDWLRAARAAGNSLSVRALPEGMASLARLYGIESLLPLEAGA
ncbi:STAS domain-containing protein [Thauera sp.]|uniref:STAS domain-containing protein n=1 Tax=Thauera sp. TaxID=1905334 RepID=UPI002BB6C7E4|nr:STAS domain-containing protein [Thauera sp.]HRP25151.1 STAS domain-containing protein [Thauera sp.]